MSKRKAPTQPEAAVFIGNFYGQHRRLPSAREMREAFNSEGSLETYAALIRTNSNLSEANQSNDHVRAPDNWDKVADLIRNLHTAEVGEKELKLEAELRRISRERDEANDRYFQLRDECKQNCTRGFYRGVDEDLYTGPNEELSIAPIEESIARDLNQRREAMDEHRAEREQVDDLPEAIPSDEDGIAF
jgi:hypothetical protein